MGCGEGWRFPEKLILEAQKYILCNLLSNNQIHDALLLKIVNNNFAKTVACKIHRIANTIFPVHLLLDMYIFSV